MRLAEIKKYCLEKQDAYEDYPFGEIPICYRIKDGGIFAQIYPDSEDYKITLRCEPEYGQFFRMAFPGVVVRGYHCPKVQQPYFNTIYLEDFRESSVLKEMIDHSYEEVLKRRKKKRS